jgi:hypothetical protein
MSNNRIHRPKTVIKTLIVPINSELKNKVKTAFQQVVTKIKEKHL